MPALRHDTEGGVSLSPKLVGKLFAMVVMVTSGAYVFVYLYRWEWNRAIISAGFFMAAEIALVAGAILDRLKAIDEKLNDPARTQSALSHLQATRPPAKDHFAWLEPQSTEMNVFVPVLLGAGVVMSGLAWVVEKLARTTAQPAMEHGLARHLGPLTLPIDGLVPAPTSAGMLDGPVLREA